MFLKYEVKINMLFFMSVLFLIVAGCQGSRVIIDNAPPGNPRAEPPHGYTKGGPPPWAPAHGYRAKHVYRYYPDAYVYYENHRGVYFYYRDGRWLVSVSLPSSIRIALGDYVTLEMDTDKPYEHHHAVVKKYPPGQLKKRKWK